MLPLLLLIILHFAFSPTILEDVRRRRDGQVGGVYCGVHLLRDTEEMGPELLGEGRGAACAALTAQITHLVAVSGPCA